MDEGSLRWTRMSRCGQRGSRRSAPRPRSRTSTPSDSSRRRSSSIDRQIGVLRDGGTVVQETRLWDTVARQTVAMRSKERGARLPILPEPDLPPVQLAPIGSSRSVSPSSSCPRRRKQRSDAGRAVEERDVVFLEVNDLVGYFEETAALSSPKGAFNWVTGEVARKLNELADR